MNIWALIPARGGSKSIPLKNLTPVCGVPLIDYSIRAVQASKLVSRIVCSTDHRVIGEHCLSLDIEVDWRSQALSGDDIPVLDVITEFLQRQKSLPDLCLLVQPTSPFLQPQHIHDLVSAVCHNPKAMSGQTVTGCPHNHHAFNQRIVKDGYVDFFYKTERTKAYNKQKKPKHYVFGNLIVFRPEAILLHHDFFVTPSVAVTIPEPYAFDLDIAQDILLAEAHLWSRLVELPHMQSILNK